MRARTAQNTVELALALPLLVLLALIAVDFGRVFFMAAAVANSSRAAAEYASSLTAGLPSENAVRDVAVTEGQPFVAPASVTLEYVTLDAITMQPVRMTWSDALNQKPQPGEPVRVTVSATFRPITPLISQMVPPTGQTVRTATWMRRNCNGPAGTCDFTQYLPLP